MHEINVLIVEDELLIAQNLSRKLKRLGYQVLDIVSSGEAALKASAEKKPNLVLMDIVIKGEIDGIETATKIYRNYGIPVIYLTAYADDKTLQRAENTGSYGYVLKPFNERELHATIRMALQKHQQQVEILESLVTAEELSKNLQLSIQRAALKIGGSEQLVLENDLHFALENQELQVYYQPLVRLQDRQIVGAEALLRWQHPKRGMISPTTFIPIAEEAGIIGPIGEWILRKACAQAKSWQIRYPAPLKISVNLSVRQFNQEGLAKIVAQTLLETDLAPELLDLELTESLLVQDSMLVVRMIDELKSIGVQLAIDDFGTGYSSLSYLQHFPFDIVKIDRSFIRSITHNPGKIAIIQAIIRMAHGLNLKVIAEGVETEEELIFLCDNHCDLAQGYLFSPPVSAESFERFLLM
ncbi:hypothetical protein BST81_12935 [Leptolyngbya sp. 'hensonii']|nr:hypothetical protein BST81_12935 [Leptolyngbya sp. 'hensonii']